MNYIIVGIVAPFVIYVAFRLASAAIFQSKLNYMRRILYGNKNKK